MKWKIVGIIAAAAAITGIALNFGDLRRYVKLEMM